MFSQSFDVDKFQSTLPLRGATSKSIGKGTLGDNFNPRSPYGERRVSAKTETVHVNFNPRSPYGERQSTH